MMHRLIVGEAKTSTACGIQIASHHPFLQTGVTVDGDGIDCCELPDHKSAIITCPKCLDAAKKPNADK